jgi:Flp pilus assembly protein TadG
MTSRRTTHRRQEGQATIEFAIVLPILLLVLLAILQFGIVFKDYLALTDAVRAGARKAAVSRHETDPAAVTEAAVRAAAKDLGPALEVKVTSSWLATSDVTVEARYPYKLKLLDVVTILDGWLVSTTKERVE